MRIQSKCIFLDGRYRFVEGGTYDVPDRRGGVYVANGWADELPDDHPGAHVTVTLDDVSVDPPPRPSLPDVALDVQNVVHATTGSED